MIVHLWVEYMPSDGKGKSSVVQRTESGHAYLTGIGAEVKQFDVAVCTMSLPVFQKLPYALRSPGIVFDFALPNHEDIPAHLGKLG